MDSSRKMISTLAAAAVTAGLVVAPQSTATAATTCTADTATFDWGLRDTWNNYIFGPIADGTGTFSGGITKVDGATRADTSYKFTGTGTVTAIQVDGSMRFAGHGGILDTELSDVTLNLNGTRATLYADLHYRDFVDTHTTGEWITVDDAVVGTWTLGRSVNPTAGKVSFASAGNGKLASEAAVEAFGGQYALNDYIAPISGSLTFAGDCGGETPEPAPGGSSSSSTSYGASLEDVQSPFSTFFSLISIGGVIAAIAGVGNYLLGNLR